MSLIRALILPALLAALPIVAPTHARSHDTAATSSGPREPTPGFDNRVLQTRDLPSAELQDARRQMLAGDTIPWADMRALADSGDGLAALRFAQRLEAEADPALLSDAALYYATAAFTNRGSAVGPLVRLLQRGGFDLAPRRRDHIEIALRALALEGDRRAADALVGFYTSGRPFGVQPGKAFDLRRELALAGDPDAALTIIMEAVSGVAPEPVDRNRVIELLDVVATSDHVGQRATAENLRQMLENGGFDDALAADDAVLSTNPEEVSQ